MPLDVTNRREMRELGNAVRGLSEGLQDGTTADPQRTIAPAWAKETRRHAATRQEQALAATATATVNKRGVQLATAQRGRLSGGLNLSTGWQPIEHGSSLPQFRPRNARGYVLGPASLAIIPIITDLWVDNATRLIVKALDGK
ncbi:hypothetical protein [Microbacterium rhizomatis]|uniref:Uncharacterized protein n=1 Tax=Microbacterium rhizomatis TaxID=1631477 RepID=A0A5J5J0D3_9MICO|nr:hypothetical protein [Microbacterium rhizomatis]KAA9105006.1 hypothetical protein F6B43_18330 [Microbacterium rhizomatis]